MELDKFYSKLAFYLSLGFWIPLLNVGLDIIALIIATQALRNIFREPKKYGGLGYVIIAMILSISSLFFTIFGFIVYLSSDAICGGAVCQAYYANR